MIHRLDGAAVQPAFRGNFVDGGAVPPELPDRGVA
jgi:hypothetical protein